MEFVFRFSHDRKQWSLVSVLSSDAALVEWQRTHARELSSTERYAIAKMALFQAFDERQPDRMEEAIRLRPADLEGIIETLGL